MRKWSHLIIAMIFIMIIAACGKEEDVSGEVTKHLEETVELEISFEENQEKVFELEKEDQRLYNEIISFGSKDQEKVIDLSKQAIELLDERLTYVKLEKESLEQSRTAFEKVEDLIGQTEQADQKELLEKMYETMILRYNTYEKVYESYVASIQLTKELYVLFQEEEFIEKKVYAVIANVNESYDEVLKANETFNKETVLYNSLKEEYYDLLNEK